MSVTRQPSTGSGRAARKAVAESYRRAVKPLTSRTKAREWRMASSSSTTWTIGLDGMVLLRAGEGEGEGEGRAAARVRLRPDAAAMGVDDGPADRQAHAQAGVLAADERL